MPRMQLTKQALKRLSAFTVVEIVIAVTLVGILFPVFGYIISTYKHTYELSDTLTATNHIKQAMWYMEETVRVANGFHATVVSPFSDPYGPHNSGTSGGEAWSYKGDSSTSRVLITSTYATTTNILGSGRQPVFKDTVDFNCTTQMYYQPQLEFTTIYFVRNEKLYRRVLTDTTSPLCAGNAQQQKESCPPEITSGRNALCQANDEVLAENVVSFDVAYFQTSQAGVSTQIDENYGSLDSTVLDSVDYVVVTISAAGRSGGDTTVTLTQRIAKVNE